jgi:hypothetical protein
MVTLCLSISVIPKWPPYICPYQWLPNGQLLSVHISDSQMDILYFSRSVPPKRTLCIYPPQWFPDGHLTFSHISDFPIDTLYSSTIVIHKWPPYLVYNNDSRMATLCLSRSVTRKWSAVDPRPCIRKFPSGTRSRSFSTIITNLA